MTMFYFLSLIQYVVKLRFFVFVFFFWWTALCFDVQVFVFKLRAGFFNP